MAQQTGTKSAMAALSGLDDWSALEMSALDMPILARIPWEVESNPGEVPVHRRSRQTLGALREKYKQVAGTEPQWMRQSVAVLTPAGLLVPTAPQISSIGSEETDDLRIGQVSGHVVDVVAVTAD